MKFWLLVCFVSMLGCLACEPQTPELAEDATAASVSSSEATVSAPALDLAMPPPSAAVSAPEPWSEASFPPLPNKLEARPARTADPVAAPKDSEGACPADMVLVSGEYCPGLVTPCLEWVQGGVKRCARFGESRCVGSQFTRRFCIDRYEYPNLRGVKPVVMVSWFDALRACEIEGKRLCLASEWTFACEGRQRYPYPYGQVRDQRVCNFDRPRPTPEPNFNLFAQPREVGAEVTRLDLRIHSGRLESCTSPFGVHDMVGNVDEWVLNENHFEIPETKERKPPFISGLKGGYWGPIRAACRPITTSHNESFRFYQVGFRCCANALTDPDGVADRYTHRLRNWRVQAGLRPQGGPIEGPPK